MQPNPSVAGPPSVALPQALNRYGVTSMGAVGVGAGASARFNLGGYALDLAVESVTEYLGRQSVVVGREQYAILQYLASKTALGSSKRIPLPIRRLFGDLREAPDLSGRYIAQTSEVRLIQQADEMAVLVEGKVYRLSELRGRLPGGAARLGQGELTVVSRERLLYAQLDEVAWFRVGEFGVDLVLGFVTQYAEDIGNPYLTYPKVLARSGVSAVGGAIFSAGGAWAGAKLGLTASPLCGPFAEICAPAFTIGRAILGAVTWNEIGQPLVFDVFSGTLGSDDRKLLPMK